MVSHTRQLLFSFFSPVELNLTTDKNWKLNFSKLCHRSNAFSESMPLLMTNRSPQLDYVEKSVQLGGNVYLHNVVDEKREKKTFEKISHHSISFHIFFCVRRVSSCWCFVRRKALRMRSKHGSSGIHDNIRWSKEFWMLVS